MSAPHSEVRTAWHATETIRSIYDIDDPDLADELMTRLGADLQDESCPPEVRQLGRLITRWSTQIAVAPSLRVQRTNRSEKT